MALPKLEVPSYQLTLPSNGKQITFRPFLVKEHKILMTISEASEEEVIRVIKELVDVCTFKKLDVNKLPHFDIEYIFMQLRAKSIGEKVDVIITCTECGEKYDHSFSIENLTVENIGASSNKIKVNDTVVVELSYPKFDSVVNLFNSEDTLKVIDVVLDSILAVYDGDTVYEAKDQTREDLEEFILSFTKDQFDKIEEFFVKSPKVVQNVESNCPKCNNHNKSRIEGLQNFFV